MSQMYNLHTHTKTSAGYLLVFVLVFGSVFLVIISSFVGYVITQSQVINFRHEQARATEIAEAGLNYYKWYLAHYPDDVTEGTGLPGPYVHVYNDPEAGAIGEFSLDISHSSYCGSIASIEVTSTGYTYDDPSAVSTISARYTRPTVAEYSFITEGGSWYGDDRVITGPVHSNQGIRMDGYHNSFVGSGVPTWDCTGTFGCSPTKYDVDGVYTTSGHATPGLFSFPITPVNFANFTIDLVAMKDRAENHGGIYYGPSGGSNYGYQVVFNGDDTVKINRVTGTIQHWEYSSADGWNQVRNVISSTSSVATKTIDSNCPLLYFADKIWLEGDVSQKVSLASEEDIIISDNIDYVSGTDAGLLAIANHDVLIGLKVPYNLQANGIFIAQTGHYGRNHYVRSGFYGLPSSLDPYVCRGTLTRYGSVVSNGRVGTKWGGSSVCPGPPSFYSGFENRITSFDQDQVDDPPPLTPKTSSVYIFDDWRKDG